MMRLLRREGTVLAFTMVLAACGGTTTLPPRDGGSAGSDGGGGAITRRLAVIGSPLVQAEAGAILSLRVALVQDDVGPIAGETVSFQVVGQAAGSVLGVAAAVTDAQGIASVELTAGSTETTFQVAATAPLANQAAFAVQVIRRSHFLRIVKVPSVRVQADGVRATVETTAFTQVLLRVRVTDQFGEPVSGEAVTFAFKTPVKSSTLEGAGGPSLTGAGGEAQVTLLTGIDLVDTFQVTGRTESSPTAVWTVTLSDAGVKVCQSNTECPPGQYCSANGICEGTPGCDPTGGQDCPTGYRCTPSGECEPVFSVGCTTAAECGVGFKCEAGQCVSEVTLCDDAQNPCPTGFTCSGGACQPTGAIPDISGGWYTAHTFHIREALPSVLDDLAGPIRTIDRLFLGELGLPGWANDIIRELVDEYVSEHIQTVVHVLDVLLTLLHDLRARGYMQVNQSGGAFTATEIWDSFTFYYLDKCSPIPADPTPDCAKVDLMVDDPDMVAELGLKVHDFNGTVGGSLVLVQRRLVEIRIAKLIGILADYLIAILTSYDTVEEAIVGAVDCEAVADLVWGLGAVESLCEGAVAYAASEVTDRLYGLAFDLGMLEFAGQATVAADARGRGINLGTPDFEQSQDGSYEGRFTKVVKDVPGEWRASRRPIQ